MALEATSKSNDGLVISGELTKGFETIAQKIEQTTLLVQDASSKEFIGKNEVRGRMNVEGRSQKAEAQRVQTSSVKKPSSSLKH